MVSSRTRAISSSRPANVKWLETFAADSKDPQLIYLCRLGVLCILLGFALGIANLFHLSALIAFSIILLYVPPILDKAVPYLHSRCCSFLLIFIEIPLLLRICPTSAKFDAFIRRFTTNYMSRCPQ